MNLPPARRRLSMACALLLPGLTFAQSPPATRSLPAVEVEAARVTGIDALNRASMMGGQSLRDLRATALNALYSVAPVRKTLMRAGLGLR